MKKFILITMFVFVLFGTAYADSIIDNFEFSVGPTLYESNDPWLNISSEIPIMELAYNFENWTLWGSFDQAGLGGGGQRLGSLQLFGLGARFSRQVFDLFNVRLGAGYYFPNLIESHSLGEAVGLIMIRQVGETVWFDKYEYDIDPGFGVQAGIGFDLSDNFSFSIDYRALRLVSNYYGRTPSKDMMWTIRDQANLDALVAMITIRY